MCLSKKYFEFGFFEYHLPIHSLNLVKRHIKCQINDKYTELFTIKVKFTSSSPPRCNQRILFILVIFIKFLL